MQALDQEYRTQQQRQIGHDPVRASHHRRDLSRVNRRPKKQQQKRNSVFILSESQRKSETFSRRRLVTIRSEVSWKRKTIQCPQNRRCFELVSSGSKTARTQVVHDSFLSRRLIILPLRKSLINAWKWSGEGGNSIRAFLWFLKTKMIRPEKRKWHRKTANIFITVRTQNTPTRISIDHANTNNNAKTHIHADYELKGKKQTNKSRSE